jgi:hypothetical protein
LQQPKLVVLVKYFTFVKAPRLLLPGLLAITCLYTISSAAGGQPGPEVRSLLLAGPLRLSGDATGAFCCIVHCKVCVLAIFLRERVRYSCNTAQASTHCNETGALPHLLAMWLAACALAAARQQQTQAPCAFKLRLNFWVRQAGGLPPSTGTSSSPADYLR